jgi:NADPH-dependent 2,4-dienoyl-CoA reductase/sulfur reductase-like enzyme
VIVGGGPAGLAAARAAAGAGVEVVIVDDNRELGGQYYRRPPPAFGASPGARPTREAADGVRLVEEVRALGVEVRLDTVAWGVFDQRTVAVTSGETTERLAARTLVLAPGAYDRPVPFPGWTLPGVLTAGGAQNLIKAYRVLPGRHVLVAGSGPLLLVVAHHLHEGGARVAAVCEAAPLRGLWRQAFQMLPHLNFVQQGYRYWRELRDAGVPLLTGHVIRQALGTTELTRAVVAACDDAWRPIVGTERSFDVDALVVGYGFVPSVELSRLAGAEHRYVAEVDAWLPVRTAELETTVPGVFVIGDGAGVAGSAVALEEGTMAGLAVAHRLGRIGGAEYPTLRARARGRLRHLAGFRAVMDHIYRVGPGLYRLAADRTTLCRCEEVTVGEARAAIAEGATQVNEIKAWTRAGMGRCQGRFCGPALAHLIAQATQRTVPEAGTFTARPPTRPVPLGALAEERE